MIAPCRGATSEVIVRPLQGRVIDRIAYLGFHPRLYRCVPFGDKIKALANGIPKLEGPEDSVRMVSTRNGSDGGF